MKPLLFQSLPWRPPEGGRAIRPRLPRNAALGVIGLSLVALAGWWCGIPWLTSLVPGWPGMKLNTALVLVAAALSLLSASGERSHSAGRFRHYRRLVGLGLALIPTLFGGGILLEYGMGRDFGMGRFFLHDNIVSNGLPLDRPPPMAALAFLLCGVALWIWRFPKAMGWFSAAAGTIFNLAWLALTALLYGVHEQHATVFFGTISLPSSLCFFLLGTGLFFLRPREGVARLFTSPHGAGRLARRLVPLAVGLTLGLGLLRLLAQRRWGFSTEMGVALYGTGMLFSLLAVALRAAWLVDRADLSRRRAEADIARQLRARTEALAKLEESETRLAASEQRFRGIFNSTFNFIGLLSPAGVVLEANQTALDLIQASPEAVIGKPFADTPWWNHSPEEQAKLHAALARCATGETVRFETSHPDASGGLHYVDFTLKPVFDTAGRVVGLVPEGRDITARLLAGAQLRESEERFRGAFENSAIGMALVGLNGRWIRVNHALCHLLGRTEEELLLCTFQDITHPDDLDADLAHLNTLLAGQADHYQMEKRYFHKDGHIVWILLAVTLVRGAHGKPVHFVSQIEDITERHLAAQALTKSLGEKEILLREIHHRVKNNLQVITSLLQLQTGYLHDPRDAVMFEECQARIHAMGLIHDRLYRSADLATIDFSAHLREITGLISRGLSGATDRIRLVVESEAVEVDLDTAIPLGLITAELITNAYKHAFAGRTEGCITVRLLPTGDQRLALTVEDDGIGLPPALSMQEARSLGLRLIRALSRQLKAQILIATPATGSRITITLPVSKPF